MSQAEATIRDTNEARPRTMAAKIGSVMQIQGALVMLVAVGIIATMRYEAFLTPENRRTKHKYRQPDNCREQ